MFFQTLLQYAHYQISREQIQAQWYSIQWYHSNMLDSCHYLYRLYFFFFSPNHRMVGVGRDLWGSSSPTPLPNHGHLKQAAQDLIQAGSEYSQRRRIDSPSGQPVPVLHHPQHEEVLPRVQMEFLMLQFVPVAPCPVTGHHWKESGPIFLTPTLKIFISISKVLSQPSLLQAKQAQLPQPFLIGEKCILYVHIY